MLLVIWCFISHYIILLLFNLGLDICQFLLALYLLWFLQYFSPYCLFHFFPVESFLLLRSVFSVVYIILSLLSNFLVWFSNSLIFALCVYMRYFSLMIFSMIVLFLNAFISLFWCDNHFLGWVYQIFVVSLVMRFLSWLNSCYMRSNYM